MNDDYERRVKWTKVCAQLDGDSWQLLGSEITGRMIEHYRFEVDAAMKLADLEKHREREARNLWETRCLEAEEKRDAWEVECLEAGERRDLWETRCLDAQEERDAWKAEYMEVRVPPRDSQVCNFKETGVHVSARCCPLKPEEIEIRDATIEELTEQIDNRDATIEELERQKGLEEAKESREAWEAWCLDAREGRDAWKAEFLTAQKYLGTRGRNFQVCNFKETGVHVSSVCCPSKPVEDDEEIEIRDATIRKFKRQIEELKEKAISLAHEKAELARQNEEKRDQIENRDATIEELERQVHDQGVKINDQIREISNLRRQSSLRYRAILNAAPWLAGDLGDE